MVYEITGKRPEPGVARHSQHTITETISAANHNEAIRKYSENNPDYGIATCFPVDIDKKEGGQDD